MKNTDLRLTNLVEYPGWNRDGSKAYFGIRDLFWEDGKVSLSNGVIQLPYAKLENLKPILLTEEWLLKAGLKLTISNNDSGYKQYGINKNGFDIMFSIECNCSPECFVENVRLKVTYVHQLQNLYFALTGEELTIS